MNDLRKRVEELERLIKRSADCPIWIDGTNNTVRIDLVGNKRGERLEFPTAHDAARWIETQIDAHPGANGCYQMDRLWDVYQDGDRLHEMITRIMGDRVIDRFGMKFSKDEFPAVLFGIQKTTQPADLNLWLLANCISSCFKTREFKERWQAQQFSEDDNALTIACLAMSSWGREGDDSAAWDGLADVFYTVTGLHAPEPA